MSRNLAASIRARLKQRADATKQDFNLTLTHFGLERLLYRLSVSAHAANYLLKGASKPSFAYLKASSVTIYLNPVRLTSGSGEFMRLGIAAPTRLLHCPRAAPPAQPLRTGSGRLC